MFTQSPFCISILIQLFLYKTIYLCHQFRCSKTTYNRTSDISNNFEIWVFHLIIIYYHYRWFNACCVCHLKPLSVMWCVMWYVIRDEWTMTILSCISYQRMSHIPLSAFRINKQLNSEYYKSINTNINVYHIWRS